MLPATSLELEALKQAKEPRLLVAKRQRNPDGPYQCAT